MEPPLTRGSPRRRRIALRAALVAACAVLLVSLAGTWAPPWQYKTAEVGGSSDRGPVYFHFITASPTDIRIDWFTFPGTELSPNLTQESIPKFEAWLDMRKQLLTAYLAAHTQLSASAFGIRRIPGGGVLAKCNWWFLRATLTALLLPTLYLTYRAFKRVLPNSCPHCRYDLSGLPPNSPCPECGQRRKLLTEASSHLLPPVPSTQPGNEPRT